MEYTNKWRDINDGIIIYLLELLLKDIVQESNATLPVSAAKQ